MIQLNQLANQYKDELLENVVPFWLEHSQDKVYGGYFSCLDRVGNVYDTDKFIWMQGRQVWLFSMLYNHVEQRREWLDCALLGGETAEHPGLMEPDHYDISATGVGVVEPEVPVHVERIARESGGMRWKAKESGGKLGKVRGGLEGENARM